MLDVWRRWVGKFAVESSGSAELARATDSVDGVQPARSSHPALKIEPSVINIHSNDAVCGTCCLCAVRVRFVGRVLMQALLVPQHYTQTSRIVQKSRCFSCIYACTSSVLLLSPHGYEGQIVIQNISATLF